MNGWMLLIGLCALIALLYMGSKRSKVIAKFSLYLALLLVAVTMILPFYWMFVLSTHYTPDIYSFPPPFWFGSALQDNFGAMMASVDVLGNFLNSAFVSLSNMVLVLLFCSMGGYAFAIYQFPGRKALFGLLLGTMMVPGLAGIVPWFIIISKIGWINNYAALIIPGCANAFGIFWMRQYCQNNVPASLMEAAKIDGCSEWLIFFRVIAPVLLPAFSALGIMQFVNVWNDFMIPMLVLRDSSMFTLPLMLSYMRGDPSRGSNVGALMLASTLSVLPLLIAFLCASKFFMSGLTAGAVKE